MHALAPDEPTAGVRAAPPGHRAGPPAVIGRPAAAPHRTLRTPTHRTPHTPRTP
ncbi:hypothetical protein SUDANB96_06364 [Streptomyces sp. enrichment culture]